MSTFNYEGHYKCECGKEFTNSQKFNGHKTQCKEHLIAVGKYENRKSLQKLFTTELAIKGSKTKDFNWKKKQEITLKTWISEKHTCEKCGKIMTEKYGSGRFCSRACANSHTRTEESKEKTSKSLALKYTDPNYTSPEFQYNFKTGVYKGYFCRSSYELIFLVYCDLKKIKWEPVKESFKYWHPKKECYKHYIPDVFLPDFDTYVEIKGHHQYYDEDEIIAKLHEVQVVGYRVLYIEDTLIKSYQKYIRSILHIKDITTLYENV